MRGDINDEIVNYTCKADPLNDIHANSPSRIPQGLQCRPQQTVGGEFQRIVGGIPGTSFNSAGNHPQTFEHFADSFVF